MFSRLLQALQRWRSYKNELGLRADLCEILVMIGIISIVDKVFRGLSGAVCSSRACGLTCMSHPTRPAYTLAPSFKPALPAIRLEESQISITRVPVLSPSRFSSPPLYPSPVSSFSFPPPEEPGPMTSKEPSGGIGNNDREEEGGERRGAEIRYLLW